MSCGEGFGRGEKIHKFFQNIHQSGERLLLLLDDLLDLSKLEAGRMELERHPYDLKKVIEIGQNEFKELANLKLLKIGIEKTDLDRALNFDQNKILQVVRNLLSNAIKFSP